MRLYVPDIGHKLKLQADWTFPLYHEHRNDSLLRYFTGEGYSWGWRENENKSVPTVTIPKDSILTVDRIYIRKGSSDYSSITFRVVLNGKSYRFWAKLEDCNKIEFQVEGTTKVLKLVFEELPTVKSVDYFSYDFKGESELPEKVIYEGKCVNVIQRKRIPLAKTKVTFDVSWSKEESKNSMFRNIEGTYWYGKVSKPIYNAYTLEDVELGSYTSAETMKKEVKEYVIKNMENVNSI